MLLQMNRQQTTGLIISIALIVIAIVASIVFTVSPTFANAVRMQLNLETKASSSNAMTPDQIDQMLSWPQAESQRDFGTEDCRIGVITGLSTDAHPTNQWIETLDASWYVNFASHLSTYKQNGETRNVDADHMAVIRAVQDIDPNTNQRLDSYKMSLSRDVNGVVTKELSKELLASFINRSRGGIWAIGNEPDREGPSQDNMAPELYARAFHEIREFILSVDPTAQFANAGLVQVTPTRIEYLNTVFDTYQALYNEPMPVDVWNIHVYPLSEVTWDGQSNGIAGVAIGSDPAKGQREPSDAAECNSGDPNSPNYNNNPDFVDDGITCFAEHDDVRIFKIQVERMRQWMKDHGQQDKPLIISEMGVLWPYVGINDGDENTCEYLADEFGQCLSPSRVKRFMAGVNDYLMNASDPNLGYSKGSEHKLVQQWAWYSVYQTLPGRQPGGVNANRENEYLGTSSNLIYDPWDYLVPGQESALTPMGEMFKSYASGALKGERTTNLYVGGTPDGLVTSRPDSGNWPIKFTVPLRNDGTTSTSEEVTVGIYSDAGFSDLIGTATAEPGVGGCGTDIGYATGTGTISSTIDRFYVKVNDGHSGNDARFLDNAYRNPANFAIPTQIRYQQGVVFLPFIGSSE